MIGTFNSILKISALEADADIGAFESCNMHALIEELIEFYEPLASVKEITLQNLLPETLTLHGEKNLLTQACANLIENAIKYSNAGGKVTISGEQSDTQTTLVVADHGVGIPEAYREKVLEKFYRMEAARSSEGKGLGLSLVAAIARIHGATLTLEDNDPGLRVVMVFKM